MRVSTADAVPTSRFARLFRATLGAELPHGTAAVFALTALLGSTGNGVFAVTAVLFLIRAVNVNAQDAGVALSLSAGVAMAATALLGRLGDRSSPRRSMIALCALRAVAYAALAAVGSFTFLIVALCLTATSDLLNKPVKQTLMKLVLPEEDRRESFALQRSIVNVAFALGALIAGVGISLDSPAVLRGLVILNAVLFIPMMVLYARLPETAPAPATVNGEPSARTGAPRGRSPWRDVRYLAFSAGTGTLMVHYVILSFALPLWIARHTAAPLALVSATWIVNTALTAVAQARVSRRIVGLAGGADAYLTAAAFLALGCGAFYLASRGGAVAASAAVLAGGVLLSVAEIIHTTAEFEVSVALAPDDSQTEYYAVTGAFTALSQLAGPVLVGMLVLPSPALGWSVLAAVVLAAALVVRLAVQPAPAPAHGITPMERA